MNIAIFGGSFDPPHIGHEKIVLKALNKLNMDKLFIIPTFLNPFKESFQIKPSVRFKLLKELFYHFDKIEVLDYEVKQERQVPTYDTIVHLYNKYNPSKIYLIIGADNLKSIHLWYNFEKFKDMVEFVVFTRDNISLDNNYIKLHPIDLNVDVSSTHLRGKKNIDFIPTKIKQKVKEIWKIE